jgi:acetyl-CoA acyltransferase
MAHHPDVFLVDAVRSPFGRASEKGVYARTRADDLVAKAIVGLLERNKQVPPDRIDDVAIAATKQQGDQGLTLGRTAGILAGLPVTVPGLAIDRMCSGAMTSVRPGPRRRSRAHGSPPGPLRRGEPPLSE